MNNDIIGALIFTVIFITCWLACLHNIRRRGLRVIDIFGVSLSTTGTALLWFVAIKTSTWENLKIWWIGLMLAAFPPLWFRKWYSGFFVDMFGIRDRREALILFRFRGFTIDFFDVGFGLMYAGMIWILLYKTSL